MRRTARMPAVIARAGGPMGEAIVAHWGSISTSCPTLQFRGSAIRSDEACLPIEGGEYV